VQVEKISPKAAEDIIKGGGVEFESEANLRKTYDKSLLIISFSMIMMPVKKAYRIAR
jgi:hypothetical protein